MQTIKDSKTEDSSQRRQRIALACLAVLAVLFAVYIFRQRDGDDAVNLRHQSAAGEVLANETAKLLNGQGEIVVVTFDTKVTPLPYAAAQLDAFKKALKQKSHITIRAVETVGYSPGGMPLPPMLSGQKYRDLINGYSGIGAIVSFAGPPELTGAEMRQLPGKLPLCLVYGSGSAQLDLKQLFGKDIVQAVVVGRLTPPDPKAARPKSTEDWFNRYYQLVTPATVGSPPN